MDRWQSPITSRTNVPNEFIIFEIELTRRVNSTASVHCCNPVRCLVRISFDLATEMRTVPSTSPSPTLPVRQIEFIFITPALSKLESQDYYLNVLMDWTFGQFSSHETNIIKYQRNIYLKRSYIIYVRGWINKNAECVAWQRQEVFWMSRKTKGGWKACQLKWMKTRFEKLLPREPRLYVLEQLSRSVGNRWKPRYLSNMKSNVHRPTVASSIYKIFAVMRDRLLVNDDFRDYAFIPCF